MRYTIEGINDTAQPYMYTHVARHYASIFRNAFIFPKIDLVNYLCNSRMSLANENSHIITHSLMHISSITYRKVPFISTCNWHNYRTLQPYI